MITFLFFSIFAFSGPGDFKDIANGFAQKSGDPKAVKISVIDESRANALFKSIQQNKEIPFRYPVDGCYARATAMTILAQKDSIEMGKIFASGKLQAKTDLRQYPWAQWAFHTAAIVYVKQNDGRVQLRVFDPTLFDAPVGEEEWKKKMLTPADSSLDAATLLDQDLIPDITPAISEVYYGSKFQYQEKTEEPSRTQWDPRVLAHAEQKLKEDLALQDPGPKLNRSSVARPLVPAAPVIGGR